MVILTAQWLYVIWILLSLLAYIAFCGCDAVVCSSDVLPCPPQSESLHKEVAVSTETLQTSKSEITDIRRTLQSLVIDHESQLSMVRHKCQCSGQCFPKILSDNLDHFHSIDLQWHKNKCYHQNPFRILSGCYHKILHFFPMFTLSTPSIVHHLSA